MHAKYNSECKHTYSPLQIENLKTHSKQVSAAKKKMKDAERHLRTYDPVKRAKKHQEKYDPVQRSKKHQEEYDPVQRAKKHQDKYDPLQRAKKYKEIRVAIALKHYRKKVSSAKKYDKALRRKKHGKIMKTCQ